MKRASLALLFLAGFAAGPLLAQPLTDPGIPDGEELVYRQTIGTDISAVKVKTARKTWNGREVYEISSSGKNEDLLVRLGRPEMEQLFSLAREKMPDTIIERQTSILKNQIKTAENEIVLVDFASLDFLMRGFPLGKSKTLNVKTARDSGFGFAINRTEDASLPAGGKTVACYRLELALTGIFGAFFPKTSYWYSVEAPHVLVRYEGASGGPGSPKKLLELTEWPKAGQ